MTRTFIVAFALLTSATTIRAQDPAALVAKLGSSNFAEREKAARLLEQLGKAALPALRGAVEKGDLETKRRATTVLEKIEDRVIIDELKEPSKIRIAFQDISVADAVGQLHKQIGLNSGKVPGKQQITRLDTGPLPYWQAWRRFCEATQLEETDTARSAAKLKRMNDNDVRALLEGLDSAGVQVRTVYAKPPMTFDAAAPAGRFVYDERHSIRVGVKWHTLERSLDAKTPHAVFAIEVRPEPRLEVMAAPQIEITKIIDADNKERLAPPARLYPLNVRQEFVPLLAGYVGEVQYGGLLQQIAIPWNALPITLKEMQGRVRAEIRVRPRLMDMPNILKAAGKQMRGLQGVAIKILEADANDDGETYVRLRISDYESLKPATLEEEVVRVRPGLVALRGPIDIAIERLELHDRAARQATLSKSRYGQVDGGKAYEVELWYATGGMKAEELTLTMRKEPRTLTVEMPFAVRDVRWQEKKMAG